MTTQLTPQLQQVKEFWEQQSCGTQHAQSEKFTKSYYDEVERKRYELEPFIRDFAQFGSWAGKDVLEVGMGAGTDFTQFVRAGANGYGIDLTAESLRHVKRRLAYEGLAAKELKQANAERLPYPDNRFDLVYSWGVIHHSENTFAALREIYRVTKPGGALKIMVYNRNSLVAWLLFGAYGLPRLRGRDWAAFHHQESLGTKLFTERRIREMLRDLSHASLRFRCFDPTPHAKSKATLVRRVLGQWVPERNRWFLTFELRKV